MYVWFYGDWFDFIFCIWEDGLYLFFGILRFMLEFGCIGLVLFNWLFLFFDFLIFRENLFFLFGFKFKFVFVGFCFLDGGFFMDLGIVGLGVFMFFDFLEFLDFLIWIFLLYLFFNLRCVCGVLNLILEVFIIVFNWFIEL